MIRNSAVEIKAVFRSGLLIKYYSRFIEMTLIYRYLTGSLEVIYGRIARGSLVVGTQPSSSHDSPWRSTPTYRKKKWSYKRK